MTAAFYLLVGSHMWTTVVKPAWGISVMLSLLSFTNCGDVRMPLDEVETLLEGQSSDGLTTVRFECRDGEAGWNYICQARYEPVSSRSRTKPRVQKLGVKRMGSYQGKPAFSLFALPGEGPVLNADQLAADRKTQAADASQRSQRMSRGSR
jgi:hypothetical protein